MVVACIALAVVLGGTSYAAIKLPRNSVGTTQLQKNPVVATRLSEQLAKGLEGGPPCLFLENHPSEACLERRPEARM